MPILLNGFLQCCRYSLDCLEALSGRKLTSDIFLGSFLVFGALCYHSEINELGGKSARSLHASLMLPDSPLRGSVIVSIFLGLKRHEGRYEKVYF